MRRRDFIQTAGLGSVSLGIRPELFFLKEISTAEELNRFLRDIIIVNEPSVDRIIIGDPKTRIKKVGTVWMPYLETLKQAVDHGINVLIVHEPTFYDHWDLDNLKSPDLPSEKRKIIEAIDEPYIEAIERKKKWIEENELVIIRSHDVMDLVKDFGMPFALGQKLGFKNEDIIRSKDYFNVYQVEEQLAINIARRIASYLADFNQPGVAFYGDPERKISSVGLGTGCICDPRDYADLHPDLCIAIDDTIRTWVQTTYAEDTGNPLVIINHGTSEENGMRLLNEFLKRNLPYLEFVHLNQGCGYKWICENSF